MTPHPTPPPHLSSLSLPNRWRQGIKTLLQWTPVRSWLGLAGVSFVVGLVLMLLFLLTLATRNRVLSEQHFEWLLMINMGVALVLAFSILYWFLRMFWQQKRQRLGSRLSLKLAGVFALVGMLPGLLIYVVSYQFVSRSIESWFDVRVESALQAGLNLGRRSVEVITQQALTQVRMAAKQLGEMGLSEQSSQLEAIREQLGASDVLLWEGDRMAVGVAGRSKYQLQPEHPTPDQMRLAKERQGAVWLEGLDDDHPDPLQAPKNVASTKNTLQGQLRLLVPVPMSTSTQWKGLSIEYRYLLVIQTLPEPLIQDALAVQTAYREYQARALARTGLNRMYLGTLTLALFLSLFGALVLAALVTHQMLRPLWVLAEGMREVARGDLNPKRALSGKDELSGLTRNFAHMTQDLALARQEAQRNMAALDASRQSLQTLLDHLNSGVVVLNEAGVIQMANPVALTLLGLKDLQDTLSEPWLGWMAECMQAFNRHQTHDETLLHWQKTFEIHTDGIHAESMMSGHTTYLVNGAGLPNQRRLLVMDDMTATLSAQRAKAWADVARRLAHEIKNPLTPIQLSAQRLQHRLMAHLNESNQALLEKSVRTIVEQVQAMEKLVNEFRDYARLPNAELKPQNLNDLIQTVLGLYNQDKVNLRFEPDGSSPMIWADAEQVRQVIHNVVQNAQDASGSQGGVVLRTTFIPKGQWVKLLVEDQGAGFSKAMLQRAFEPYVTTKAKGTGLGLALVKKIMDEHRGDIQIGNRMIAGQVCGAVVTLSFAVVHPTSVGS